MSYTVRDLVTRKLLLSGTGLPKVLNFFETRLIYRTPVRFEVFTAVTMKNGVFWDVTPCGSCKSRRFGRTWHLLHQGDKNGYFFAAYVGC
jgi:hypothetical protein